MLGAAGLLPLPDRSDLRPIVGSRADHPSYSVENVAFESFPGFFVTGNLYRPPGNARPARSCAGVLAPHGHTRWSRGSLRGRFTPELQTLCSTLATLGAVVLTYDMVGWGESRQLGHRAKANVLGLQLWNSLRAIDFLEAQPEVDPERIGMAGFSGGATQTFLARAVDERIAAAALVAQLSAHFFGGCRCERGIELDSGPDGRPSNVEIAATGAPRALLVVSTGEDWSRNTPRVEYPFLRHVYDALGAGDQVENLHLADEGHDFGPSKRQAVYRFLAVRLGLEQASVEGGGGVDEGHAVIRSRGAMCVFDPSRPRPSDALSGAEAVGEAFAGIGRSGPD